jgi:hypothetical protein
VKGGCEKVHIKELQNFTQVMEEEAGETWHGGDEKCLQNFGGKT